MDAAAHSKVWRKVGNDLGEVTKDAKTTHAKVVLGSLALFATLVGAAYHVQGKEESDAGAKV